MWPREGLYAFIVAYNLSDRTASQIMAKVVIECTEVTELHLGMNAKYIITTGDNTLPWCCCQTRHSF